MYLDSYIECGDAWNIGEHKITPHSCPNSSYESLYDKYKSIVVSDMVSLLKYNGYTLSRVKAVIPDYFKWNGGEYKVSDNTSITNVSPNIYVTDEEVRKGIETYAISTAKESVNNIVSKIDEEVDVINITFKAIS